MRKISIISILLFLCLTAKTQINKGIFHKGLPSLSTLKSSNQQILEQVVNSGVFVVRRSYELVDSAGHRYGLRGNRAFGTDYSLGVKVKNGFIVTEKTVHPWDFYSKYDKYRKKYVPEFFSTDYSEISTMSQYDSISINEDSVKILYDDLLHAVHSDAFLGDGFSVGGKIGDNDGWMVWFTKKQNSDFNNTTEMNLSIIKKNLSITPKNNSAYFFSLDSLVTDDEVVGGIFVIPQVIKVGVLELQLCGVACHVHNGWMLCCPFIDTKELFSNKFMKKALEVDSEKSKETLHASNKNDDNIIEQKQE